MELLSSFLWIGLTLAFFQISGTVELLSELLKRSVKGRVMVSAIAFRTLLLMQSGPQAFPVSRLFKIAVISPVFS